MKILKRITSFMCNCSTYYFQVEIPAERLEEIRAQVVAEVPKKYEVEELNDSDGNYAIDLAEIMRRMSLLIRPGNAYYSWDNGTLDGDFAYEMFAQICETLGIQFWCGSDDYDRFDNFSQWEQPIPCISIDSNVRSDSDFYELIYPGQSS